MPKSILLIALALSGCMNLATRSNGEAGPNWQRAEFVSSQPGPGTTACFFKQGSDTYTITSHNGCPKAVMVDTNSYRLHIDPLIQGYNFKNKCLVVEQCPSKAAEPVVSQAQ